MVGRKVGPHGAALIVIFAVSGMFLLAGLKFRKKEEKGSYV